MEEDIKVLEKFTKIVKGKDYNTKNGWHGYYDYELRDLGKTIEKLIKGYRKLKLENQALQNTKDTCPNMATSGIRCDAKEKLKELEIENQSYRDYMGEPPCYDNASYIKKSKIKEKIEKYKKLGNEFYEKFLETNKTDIDIHDAGLSCDAKAQVLQELLEEE